MTDQTILEKYKVPPHFKDPITSLYYGSNGGNPNSPIWLCALEEGGGFSKDNPCKTWDVFRKHESISELRIPQKEVKDKVRGIWLRDENGQITSQSNSRLFQVYVMLLTALINGKLDCDSLNKNKISELDKLIDKYHFFDEGCYGFLMESFPVSMPNRRDAPKLWDDDNLVRTSETNPDERTSFAKWTNIPTFDEYLKWCSAALSKTFCTLRRKYHPALIYCGGLSQANLIFDMWTDEQDNPRELPAGHQFYVTETESMRFQYRWVNNDSGNNRTLLVVGPFYSGTRYSINYPETCEIVARELRKLMGMRVTYVDDDSWLRKEDFPHPDRSKKSQ